MTAFANDTISRRPGLSSRLSIDRYLNAPLSDEPASAPAISRALRSQSSRHCFEPDNSLEHSCSASVDARSVGHRTFFTIGSVPETADTIYSQESRARSRVDVPVCVNINTSTRWTTSDHGNGNSPIRATTSDAVGPSNSSGMAKEWAERIERLMPRFSEDHNIDLDSRAAAASEILRIQEKARELEVLLEQYESGHKRPIPVMPKLTNASAHALMDANPKLAWILGDDAMDARSVARPKSTVSTVNEVPERPKTASEAHHVPLVKTTRRTKSIGVSADEHHESVPSSTVESSVQQQPVKRSRYYCTFCQKRLNNRNEWLRHESAVHIQEELWVCCPRTGRFPTRCPFCEKRSPSPAHLADHNYLSCQEKPLSERSFGNRDQFLQHISQMHRIDAGQKPARLTELLDAWRQPLPINIDLKALHCGFCGIISKSYQERTAHVGRHFSEGADMMSWWSDRISHAMDQTATRNIIPNRYVSIACTNCEVLMNSRHDIHQCVYCSRTFQDLATAQEQHATCHMWSCSFLPGLQYTIHSTGARGHMEALCCFCNSTLARGAEGKVNSADLKGHMLQHNFRACGQKLYFSAQRFRQHLQDSHNISHHSSLFAGWTLLLKSCRQERRSVFSQPTVRIPHGRPSVDTDAKLQTTNMKLHEDKSQTIPMSFMDLSDPPQRTEPNKLRRKPSAMPVADEPRVSTQSFARPAIAGRVDVSTPRPIRFSRYPISKEKPDSSLFSTLGGESTCPTIYRKRLDASMRNRLYVSEGDQSMSSATQQLYMKMAGGTLGSLILYSSLTAAIPARLTNSVDIYTLP